MPTVRFDSPREKEKIALAKEYSDRVKAISYSYNDELERVWRKWMPSLRLALQRGDATAAIVDALVSDMRALLVFVVQDAADLAVEREFGTDNPKYLLYGLLPLEVPQCNISYYEEALDKYREILELDLIIATEMGFADELEMFLYNPLAFLAGDADGLIRLKNEVPAGKGVSYSFFENMKRLGISAAALSYANALHHIWQKEGAAVFYYGVRNSNYPCELCDSYAYVLQPMGQMVYPLHNRCVCTIVPVYQNDMS